MESFQRYQLICLGTLLLCRASLLSSSLTAELFFSLPLFAFLP